MVEKIEQAKSIIALALVLFLISVLFLMIFPIRIFLAAYTGLNTINALPACVVISATCTPSFTNTAIIFPSNIAGGLAPTTNDVNVLDTGNLPTNIYVGGNAWTYIANSFAVGNTLWSPTSGGNIGTQLTGAVSGADTQIRMKANLANDIFFGVNIPQGQTAATYTQTINVLVGGCSP
jgi:hypothetical protein